jgi:LPXTG-site transpeptidase (sortase) family protein
VLGTGTVVSPNRPARADLAIQNLSIGVVKGFDPLTVFGGSASTLSIELVNPNRVALNGISFTDTMPSGMLVANPSEPDVGDCGGTLDAASGSNSFSFSGGSLAAATSCVLTLRVTMTVNGNLTNTIEASAVTTLSGAVNPDPAEASLTNLPGASISKAFSPNPVGAGDVSLLTFTIQNTGSVPLSGMGFEDDLPGDLPIGLEIAASPSPVNNCGGTLTAVAGTQLIKLEDGVLDTNAACTLVIPILGNIQGSYTNTIEAGKLTSNEGATNHDSTTATLVVTGTAAGGSGSGGDDDDQGVVVRGAGRGAANIPPALLPAVSGFLIPVTGFRPDATTSLNEATRPSYDALDLQIEIPVIDVNTSIMGVQIKDGSWDISWLQDQVGWLNGTAYPTWNGNSVLTAHVVDADGQPGVFSRLEQVGVGEYIYIFTNGYRYTYQVISNQSVDPSDISVFRHEKEAYLTLITCDAYDENSDTYLLRIAIRSKLVDIRPVQ